MKETDIKDFRKQIDRLDEILMTTLSKRMVLMPQIAEYKRRNKMPLHQPQREEEIIKNKRAMADIKKLNPDFVEEIYRRIFKEARRIQSLH